MSWRQGTLAALALELDGDDVETGRITSACVMRVDGSGRAAPSSASWRIGPGAESAGEALPELVAMLIRALRAGVPVVAYDLPRALTVLDRECRRHEIPTLSELVNSVTPVVCVRTLDRYITQAGGPRTMADVCAKWDVTLGPDADAAAVAFASAGLAVRLAEHRPDDRFVPKPHIAGVPLDRLQVVQADAHRTQRRAEALRLRRLADAGKTVDDQLDLIEHAKRALAEAEHWPVMPLAEQGVIA